MQQSAAGEFALANYYLYGNTTKLFDQFGSYEAPFSIATQLLYLNATEFGVLNADGKPQLLHRFGLHLGCG